MPKLGTFAVSPTLLADGVLAHVGEGGYITVRRWHNAEHIKRIAELLDMPANKDRDFFDVHKEAAAGTVFIAMPVPPDGSIDHKGRTIKGAKPWLDEKGKALPFTQQLAVELMTAPKWLQFQELVCEVAMSLQSYREHMAEQARKN